MPFSKMITWIDAQGEVRVTPRDDYDRMTRAVKAVENAVARGEDVDIERIIEATFYGE